MQILFGLKRSAEYEYDYHYSISTIGILFECRIIRSLLTHSFDGGWMELLLIFIQSTYKRKKTWIFLLKFNSFHGKIEVHCNDILIGEFRGVYLGKNWNFNKTGSQKNYIEILTKLCHWIPLQGR